jgi:hypothetical protein
MREANLLVALEQLRFVKTLIAEFETRPPFMPPLSTIQAQYVAIVAMLRSIGHVFEKVECDSPEKKKWCKAKWPDWKNEAIFRDFIEPNRNRLLKEFEGGLTLKTPGVGSGPVVADPGKPEGVSFLADLRRYRAPR